MSAFPNWRCPKCGGLNLDVTVQCTAKLQQSEDGDFQTVIEGSDHEWDRDSIMWCCNTECLYTERSREFEVSA